MSGTAAPAPPGGGYSLFPSADVSRTPSQIHPRKQPPRAGRRSESRDRTRGHSVERGSRGRSVERRVETPLQGRASVDGPYTPQQQQQQQQPQQQFAPSPSPHIGAGRSTPQLQTRIQTPVESQSQTAFSPQTFSPQDTITSYQSPSRDGRQSALSRREQQQQQVQQPRVATDVPPRSDTAFSQANTLVRSPSVRSRSSIAKIPFPDDNGGPSSSAHPEQHQPIQSIFPTYNPDVPLNRQEYFPTQTNPAHIPRAVISRNAYRNDEPRPAHFDDDDDDDDDIPAAAVDARSAAVRSPVRSPMAVETSHAAATATASRAQWPARRGAQEPPTIPTTSTTEHLKNLWKVSNGWRASPSEGRVFCLKLSQEKDAPVYTLSSTTQPFYNLRLDPTSASAYVTLSRHDPNKACKAPPPTLSSSSSSVASGRAGHAKDKDAKNWQEALTTTLEEESRRHQPNDGLVALLYPTTAAKMALERPDDMAAVMTAENECARLVWDDDSASHYLVHPALATPFCVTIDRAPAWSRTEYTLEHHESPRHLAKLTRDGTGTGWLEVDTAVAAHIEAFFVVDVAVAALVLVAAADERNSKVETFEPPPAFTAGRVSAAGSHGEGPSGRPGSLEHRLSKLSSVLGSPRSARHDGNGGRKSRGSSKKKGSHRRMEEFEMDLESQSGGSFGKVPGSRGDGDDDEKLPRSVRLLIAVLTGVFKLFIWVLSIGFRTIAFFARGCLRCCGLHEHQ